jgi:quercetin dioxygenase-like cupin family protein
MPIEVRRFGVGYRRPEGPPGTTGLTGQVIHSDARGVVSEYAFARGARIESHSNPNTTYFIVIEGGGWVSIGDERSRVAAGEAIVWPANIEHAAWTDHSPMRVFIVEFAGEDDSALRGILPGVAKELSPGETGQAEPGEGALAPREIDPERVDRSSGEPL